MPISTSAGIARLTRPLRRRITPNRFKETYIRRDLGRRQHPTTYLEIGVRDGESFRVVRADRKVAVDPQKTKQMSRLKPGEEFFEATSDRFFGDYAARVLRAGSIDVALVDGLHEFRQVLRDVLNLEPYMRPDGVIFLDDINPPSPERARDTPTGGAWNGDVWKIGPLLTSQRQDLEFFTIDADEGVGVIRRFGTIADWPKPDAVQGFKDLPYEYLSESRARVLNLVEPSKAPSGKKPQ